MMNMFNIIGKRRDADNLLCNDTSLCSIKDLFDGFLNLKNQTIKNITINEKSTVISRLIEGERHWLSLF